MPQRLGILGGSFNPPHLGHLAIASHALAQLALERVLLMPSHTPPHKLPQNDPGPSHRLRMCELALAGHEGLDACALEIERGGASYTVDTLISLHALRPFALLTLILGSDMARTLPTWRGAEELLRLAEIAVAERPGDGPVQLPAGARASALAMPMLDISSSMVRERVARGEAVEELVGPAVAGYIAEHGLYRQASEARAS